MHLAAQAGVRYSLENPHAYVDANCDADRVIHPYTHAKFYLDA